MASLVTRGSALLLGVTLVGVAFVAPSCGDPLVDSSYRGVPLFTLQGQTYGTSYMVQLEKPTVRLAMFWNVTGVYDTDLEKLVEQPASGLTTAVPLSFILNLFEPPPDSALLTYGAARFGIGRLLAYVDANGNGQRDKDEPFVGMDNSRSILYAPVKIAKESSPTLGNILPGFHIASLPLPCNPSLMQPEMSDTDCGVPRLGMQCKADTDCGAGVCLTHFLIPWPRGSCAIRDPPPDRCVPKNTIVVKGPPETSEAYRVRSCESDADCGREFPYICDLMTSACMPSAMQQIQIGDNLAPGTFCLPPQGDGGMMMPHGDGGACPPGPDGGSPPLLPDGGCPGPPPDGGMIMPPSDGGSCPPDPDGGIPPRFADGGCPMGPPPDGGGQCPPGPDGGTPPRLSDGGCPGRPPG